MHPADVHFCDDPSESLGRQLPPPSVVKRRKSIGLSRLEEKGFREPERIRQIGNKLGRQNRYPCLVLRQRPLPDGNTFCEFTLGKAASLTGEREQRMIELIHGQSLYEAAWPNLRCPVTSYQRDCPPRDPIQGRSRRTTRSAPSG